MYGSMIHIQSAPITITSLFGRSFARHSHKRVREPLTNYYRCADDRWILLCEVRGDEYWPQLARALGIGQLANDVRFTKASARRQNYEELIQILEDAFASKALQEWLDIFHNQGLDEAGFSYSPVFTHNDVLNDPQALENDYIINFNHPTFQNIKIIGHPIKFDATPAEVKCAAPEHGQHTEEILSELLGYDWDKMAKFREEGII
jgi:crotonobetainyl-CoA:carnitine CoA-transferase CaiB-like acyl-CoA transferase